MVEEKSQRLTSKYTEEEKKTLSKTIEELFLRITSTLKLAQIFEPNNEAFICSSGETHCFSTRSG